MRAPCYGLLLAIAIAIACQGCASSPTTPAIENVVIGAYCASPGLTFVHNGNQLTVTLSSNTTTVTEAPRSDGAIVRTETRGCSQKVCVLDGTSTLTMTNSQALDLCRQIGAL